MIIAITNQDDIQVEYVQPHLKTPIKIIDVGKIEEGMSFLDDASDPKSYMLMK